MWFRNRLLFHGSSNCPGMVKEETHRNCAFHKDKLSKLFVCGAENQELNRKLQIVREMCQGLELFTIKTKDQTLLRKFLRLSEFVTSFPVVGCYPGLLWKSAKTSTKMIDVDAD